MVRKLLLILILGVSILSLAYFPTLISNRLIGYN